MQTYTLVLDFGEEGYVSFVTFPLQDSGRKKNDTERSDPAILPRVALYLITVDTGTYLVGDLHRGHLE